MGTIAKLCGLNETSRRYKFRTVASSSKPPDWWALNSACTVRTRLSDVSNSDICVNRLWRQARARAGRVCACAHRTTAIWGNFPSLHSWGGGGWGRGYEQVRSNVYRQRTGPGVKVTGGAPVYIYAVLASERQEGDVSIVCVHSTRTCPGPFFIIVVRKAGRINDWGS